MSDHTPQNENYLESPSQDTKVEGYANTGGGREAWCTVAGGYGSFYMLRYRSAHEFCQDGWHSLEPLDTYHPLEYTRISMFWPGLRPLQALVGSAPRSSGFSFSWAYLQEPSSTKDISNKLFLLAHSFIYSGLFGPSYVLATFSRTHSIFMLSLAHVDCYYQVFLSQGVGMGIGSGLIYLPAMAVQSHHWKARRALAMGIVITGRSIT